MEIQKYSAKDIEMFNNEFLEEYAKLRNLLFTNDDEYREINIPMLNATIDLCKLKLQNIKKIKPYKFKGFSGF